MLLNQKSPRRSRGNDSSPGVEREGPAGSVCSSKVLGQMFQGVAAGLPPSMSTEMFQTSIQVMSSLAELSSHLYVGLQSIKQLSARLSTFFRHGLATNQVLISLVLVRQFSFHRNYPLALVNSLSELAKHKCCSTAPGFVDLIIRVLEELGSARNLLTSPIVDMVLQWTMPQMNKKQEVSQSGLALKLVEEVGQFVWEDSKYSFQFVYHQIRARLLGSSKTDFSQESNYGVLCFETKSILLDILIAMCRLRDNQGFFLEPRLVMAGSDKPAEGEENNNNNGGQGDGGPGQAGAEGKSNSGSSQNSVFYSEKHSLKKDQPGDGAEEEGQSSSLKQPDETIYSRSVMTASIRSSSVRLLTPQMIEDDMKSRMSSSASGLLTNYKTPHFNTVEVDDDVLSLYEVGRDLIHLFLTILFLQDPVDSVLYDQKGGDAEGVLGYLVASDGSRKYEISNCYCIGRSVGSFTS